MPSPVDLAIVVAHLAETGVYSARRAREVYEEYVVTGKKLRYSVRANDGSGDTRRRVHCWLQ